MPQYFNVEWLNSNSVRAYPLAEHATKTDKTGSITIPDSFLVELYLPLGGNSAYIFPDKFFLSRLFVLGGAYMIEIGLDTGSGNHTPVATASIPESGFTEYSRYTLSGVGDWADSIGKVVIGSLTDVKALPSGAYEFDATGGALDVDTLRPMLGGVSSLIVEQNGQQSAKLTGDVVLQAGSNIRLSAVTVDGEDPVILIDAIPDGSSFGASDCACSEIKAPCIRTINSIGGDAHQNFTLLGDDCLVINKIPNGLKLKDVCCTPCCGCNELSEVIRALQSLETTAVTLESFMQRLFMAQNTLQVTTSNMRMGLLTK